MCSNVNMNNNQDTLLHNIVNAPPILAPFYAWPPPPPPPPPLHKCWGRLWYRSRSLFACFNQNIKANTCKITCLVNGFLWSWAIHQSSNSNLYRRKPDNIWVQAFSYDPYPTVHPPVYLFFINRQKIHPRTLFINLYRN